MTLGERLNNERKKLNLSTEEVAKRCGVSRSYITLIENNQRFPSSKVLPKLAQVFQVKTNVVLNWYLEDVREKMEKKLNIVSE